MQTAGYAIAAAAELAAGVQNRKGHLQSALPSLMFVHRDAAPEVPDGYAAIGPERDHHLIAKASHEFVDRIVDDFPEQVVHAAVVGAADVHARAAAHPIQPFQDLDLIGVI